MTQASTRPAPVRARTAVPRRFLMCPPSYFDVVYAINPWMDTSRPVDRALALQQWETLRATYVALGHRVEVLDPLPGQPDMVFAANGGLVVGGRALSARFRHPERTGEEAAFHGWLAAAGIATTQSTHVSEGEGDFLVGGLGPGALVLAGTGFRTDPAAHAEAATVLGRQVVTLELVDPRYYHLDTAMAVLDDTTVVVLPQAFGARSLARLHTLFPEVVVASGADAAVLGVNAVSDGRHVVLEAAAEGLAEQLRERGFVPVPVDLSELRRAGGAVKCCTLELRDA